MRPKSFLVTGGCGFIGRSLIKRLCECFPDSHIRVLDNLSVGTREDLAGVVDCGVWSGKAADLSPGVFLIVADIRSFESVLAASGNVDCVVHLAANTGVGPSVDDPRYDMEANVFGVFNLLEAARQSGVKKFVFASSGAPAGAVEPPIHEAIAPRPVSPYGASKLAGEGYCSAYYQTFGIDTISLRFGNVYGPNSGHKSSVVAKFIKQALREEVCELYGDGGQTRDYIYIDDLVSAVICAIQSRVGGEVFQIASGLEVTLVELVEKIREALAVHDISLQAKNVDVRLGDVRRNYSDISKARRILGWAPKYNLSAGLALTVEYFVSRRLG
ncbi:NAD-dependent epimerase/dehydratase family protein [Stutzerimonas balearica]|uniref:NAD-dependent epimerase/dehydratase family protein n=1 Tax=Stutzerimonas balearica TaxID=74829 RepID=UPI00190CF2C4|nr:NAD-dependent epimerase/dehydratase family protein [Stutzerimonas balearica]MBK3748442.1 NAD-dependent epimerase/dehydratase family protein [Stutzerimonas balearica]MBK3826639.1 NAD-dependent epimerase/dehydratase family protein [Stutzerimonas balearica]MBK3856329.1 NAD-dependent epimerase/dehydratase family protein [Stutzerimonas balearica]